MSVERAAEEAREALLRRQAKEAREALRVVDPNHPEGYVPETVLMVGGPVHGQFREVDRKKPYVIFEDGAGKKVRYRWHKSGVYAPLNAVGLGETFVFTPEEDSEHSPEEIRETLTKEIEAALADQGVVDMDTVLLLFSVDEQGRTVVKVEALAKKEYWRMGRKL